MPNCWVLAIETEKIHLDEEGSKLMAEARPDNFAYLSVADIVSDIDSDTIRSISNLFFTIKRPGKDTKLSLMVMHGIVKTAAGGITLYGLLMEVKGMLGYTARTGKT
jgi:hypothetical protein